MLLTEVIALFKKINAYASMLIIIIIQNMQIYSIFPYLQGHHPHHTRQSNNLEGRPAQYHSNWCKDQQIFCLPGCCNFSKDISDMLWLVWQWRRRRKQRRQLAVAVYYHSPKRITACTAFLNEKHFVSRSNKLWQSCKGSYFKAIYLM